MKCLQGLYFNFMVWRWKSMKLTPHIAIRDPKTGMSRQEWFGPFFLFLIPLVLLLQPHHFVPYGAHGCRVTKLLPVSLLTAQVYFFREPDHSEKEQQSTTRLFLSIRFAKTNWRARFIPSNSQWNSWYQHVLPVHKGAVAVVFVTTIRRPSQVFFPVVGKQAEDTETRLGMKLSLLHSS